MVFRGLTFCSSGDTMCAVLCCRYVLPSLPFSPWGSAATSTIPGGGGDVGGRAITYRRGLSAIDVDI